MSAKIRYSGKVLFITLITLGIALPLSIVVALIGCRPEASKKSEVDSEPVIIEAIEPELKTEELAISNTKENIEIPPLAPPSSSPETDNIDEGDLWTENIYDSTTGALTDAKQYIYEVSGSNKVPVCVSWEKREYDQAGRVWRTRKLADPTTTTPGTISNDDMVTLIQYDMNGNVLKKAVKGVGITSHEAITTSDIVTVNKYHDDGKLDFTIDPELNTTGYVYDSYGRSTEVYRQVFAGTTAPSNDETGIDSYTYTTYDDEHSTGTLDSRIITELNEYVDPGYSLVVLALLSKTSYDDVSRVERSIVITGEVDTVDSYAVNTEPTYDSRGRTIRTLVYQDEDTPTVTTDDVELSKTVTIYDNLGRVTRQATFANPTDSAIAEEIDRVVDYEYFDDDTEGHHGMLEQIITYNNNSDHPIKTDYYYDDFDRQKYTASTSANCSYTSSNCTCSYTSYAGINYNAAGQVSDRWAIDLNETGGDNVTVIADMEYDKYGHVITQRQIPVDSTAVDTIDPEDIDHPDDLNNYVTLPAHNATGDALCLVTEFEYDGLGRLCEVKDPICVDTTATTDGSTTSHTYAGNFGLKSKIEILQANTTTVMQRTDFDYDRLGRQEYITGYANYATAPTVKQTTKYVYDDLSRITQVVYPKQSAGQSTAENVGYNYNSLSKVVKRTDQNGIVTGYRYDIRGNLLIKSAWDWVTIDSTLISSQETFRYDAMGRMTSATRIDDTSGNASYVAGHDTGFDVSGGDTEISSTAFDYTDTTNGDHYIVGPRSVTDKYFGSTSTENTSSYLYDQQGSVTQIRYPATSSNVDIDFSRDSRGRIDVVSQGSTDFVDYSYVGSNVATRTYPEDSMSANMVPVVQQYTYNNFGQIAGITGFIDTDSDGVFDTGETAKTEFTYLYDKNSNITDKEFGHRSSDPDNIYIYDDLNRLTGTTYHDSTSDSFTMDDLGNRDSATNRGESAKTYAIDSITNRYDDNASDNIYLAYDDAGNTTTDQDGYLYTWDYENRIVNIKDSSDNDVVYYTYDALGRRIRKIDMPGHSTLESTTLYWYNNNWQVLAETDGADSLERIFLYGNYIDEVLIHQEVANSYQLYYQLQDHLYSSVALLDQNNTVVQRVEYDSYGKPSKLNDNFTTFSGADTGNPYCFTGRRVDVLDGEDKVLQYSRNRYLDYVTGRWLSHDPLGFIDGLNMYQYVLSVPTIYLDPLGLQFCVTVMLEFEVAPYRPLTMPRPVIRPLPLTRPHIGTPPSLVRPVPFINVPRVCSKPKPVAIPKEGIKSGEKGNYGDCTKAQHRSMQNMVNLKCKGSGPLACDYRMGPGQLNEQRDKLRACKDARSEINNICFGGGNPGHAIAVDNMVAAIAKCNDYLSGFKTNKTCTINSGENPADNKPTPPPGLSCPSGFEPYRVQSGDSCGKLCRGLYGAAYLECESTCVENIMKSDGGGRGGKYGNMHPNDWTCKPK
ncbi:MAG: hypothetical protein JEZ07_19035 [Phycisphaerae bacterium]|nr:hypothetical protein [Phycisphaerae bacterium]